MSSDLEDSLQRLEDILASAGAAVVSTLRSGIDPAQGAALLGDLDLEPSTEILSWFGWHDGAGEHGMPSVAIELVPGGEFYGLEYLIKECRNMRAVAAQLWAEHPAVVPEADIWAPTWFPLLRLGGRGFVLVDLASNSAVTSPVQVMWHDDGFDQRAIVAWPSITAFVDTVIERFESGEYWVDEVGLVSGDTIDFPDGQA